MSGAFAHVDLTTGVLVRSAAYGIVLGIVAILSPLGVRLCFGAMSPRYFAANAIGFTATLIVGVVPMVLVSRNAVARGASLGVAFALGMLAAIPVMVASREGQDVLPYRDARQDPSGGRTFVRAVVTEREMCGIL